MYQKHIIKPLEILYKESVRDYMNAWLFKDKYKKVSDDIFKELMSKYEVFYNLSKEEFEWRKELC